jgi:2-polyprenyl-3-methyl-5-hydroxy-6-metoxy-1,4-benzoquinol methylase
MGYRRSFHVRRKDKPFYEWLAQAALDTVEDNPTVDSYKSVLEIGCSIGELLRHVNSIDEECITAGIDCGVLEEDLRFSGTYVDLDLNAGAIKSIEGMSTADLIITQEVVEHINPESEDNVIDIICDLASPEATLVFGGAVPNQRGKNHVNCRTKKYWQEKLEERGWTMDKEMTEKYQESLKKHGKEIPGYYRNNTACFVKTTPKSEDS